VFDTAPLYLDSRNLEMLTSVHTIGVQLTSRKPMQCTGKLFKIKSKLILISFTSFVDIFFFFFVVENIVGKIDKETLRIRFRIDPTFLFKKIIKKVFTIG
jgi:hypothetical protein